MHPTRPLSNLEKVLAAGSIILLLLMCTFIGLFAGAEVQLKKERAGKGHEGSGTVTTTWTETATATSTKVATTTVGSVPTGKPEAVSDGRARVQCAVVEDGMLAGWASSCLLVLTFYMKIGCFGGREC